MEALRIKENLLVSAADKAQGYFYRTGAERKSICCWPGGNGGGLKLQSGGRNEDAVALREIRSS